MFGGKVTETLPSSSTSALSYLLLNIFNVPIRVNKEELFYHLAVGAFPTCTLSILFSLTSSKSSTHMVLCACPGLLGEQLSGELVRAVFPNKA